MYEQTSTTSLLISTCLHSFRNPRRRRENARSRSEPKYRTSFSLAPTKCMCRQNRQARNEITYRIQRNSWFHRHWRDGQPICKTSPRSWIHDSRLRPRLGGSGGAESTSRSKRASRCSTSSATRSSTPMARWMETSTIQTSAMCRKLPIRESDKSLLNSPFERQRISQGIPGEAVALFRNRKGKSEPNFTIRRKTGGSLASGCSCGTGAPMASTHGRNKDECTGCRGRCGICDVGAHHRRRSLSPRKTGGVRGFRRWISRCRGNL